MITTKSRFNKKITTNFSDSSLSGCSCGSTRTLIRFDHCSPFTPSKVPDNIFKEDTDILDHLNRLESGDQRDDDVFLALLEQRRQDLAASTSRQNPKDTSSVTGLENNPREETKCDVWRLPTRNTSLTTGKKSSSVASDLSMGSFASEGSRRSPKRIQLSRKQNFVEIPIDSLGSEYKESASVRLEGNGEWEERLDQDKNDTQRKKTRFSLKKLIPKFLRRRNSVSLPLSSHRQSKKGNRSCGNHSEEENSEKQTRERGNTWPNGRVSFMKSRTL